MDSDFIFHQDFKEAVQVKARVVNPLVHRQQCNRRGYGPLDFKTSHDLFQSCKE